MIIFKSVPPLTVGECFWGNLENEIHSLLKAYMTGKLEARPDGKLLYMHHNDGTIIFEDSIPQAALTLKEIFCDVFNLPEQKKHLSLIRNPSRPYYKTLSRYYFFVENLGHTEELMQFTSLFVEAREPNADLAKIAVQINDIQKKSQQTF